MEKIKHNSDYKKSVTLKNENKESFFAYIEEINYEYVILRGLEDKEYKRVFLSMYPYYYNDKNIIIKQSFIEVPILFSDKIKHGVYKFRFEYLTDAQSKFLKEYVKFWMLVEGKLHESNTMNLDFELAFNLINPKIENLITTNKIREIFEHIKSKMNLSETIIGKLPLSRVYYGNEFCPKLLPSKSKLDFIFDKVENENMNLTLLTPTLYQEDAKKTYNLMSYINRYGEENRKVIEVVFNNWGTYQLLKDMKYIKPVLGRLLIKLRRDSRYSYKLNELFAPYNMELRSGDLSVEVFRDFLLQKNITQVEVDCLPQGIPVDLEAGSPINLHLHFPFYVMAISRMCMFGVLNRDFETLFDYKQPCKLECKRFYYDSTFLDKVKLQEDNEAKKSKSIIKGRAFFSQYNNWREEFDFGQAYQKNIKRIIFYHEIPY